MKEKNKVELSVIRMVKASIQNEQIKSGHELSDEDQLTVLNRELKQRKDSLHEFEQAGRHELVERQHEEIKVLHKYMPEQLSEEEVRNLVAETIAETGAQQKSDMGKVMAAIMPKVKGKADGSVINRLVQEQLS